MMRIATFWIVAFMTDVEAILDWPGHQHEYEAVRSNLKTSATA
jgi:hypothetical protein